MSASARSRVRARLRELAEGHEAQRGSNRWMLRGLGWGFLILFWLIVYYGDGPQVALGGGCLVPILIFGGFVEAGLGFAYGSTARVHAREFNRAFPGGTARDEAVALLRERRREGWEAGRAARRCLRALHLPLEEPPGETEPAPAEVPSPARVPALDLSPPGPELRPSRRPRRPAATIPIEVAPRKKSPPTSRAPAPAPLPLQPEAARTGEKE